MSAASDCTAIVLAAGCGTRLAAVHDSPKGFIDIGGQPIIARSLNLLAAAGVVDVVMVTGWKAEVYSSFLRERFPHVRIVTNDAYRELGSLHSLTCALPFVSSDALIVESDLLYEAGALPALLRQPDRDVVLLSGPTQSGDEVWVYSLADDRLASMVKEPWPSGSLAGELVGLSRVSHALLEKIAQSARALHPNARYEDGFNAVCTEHPVTLLRVDDLAWCEIDTADHLDRARRDIWPRIVAADAVSAQVSA